MSAWVRESNPLQVVCVFTPLPVSCLYAVYIRIQDTGTTSGYYWTPLLACDKAGSSPPPLCHTLLVP